MSGPITESQLDRNSQGFACIVEGGRAPTVLHATVGEAVEEAKRLALKERKGVIVVVPIASVAYEQATPVLNVPLPAGFAASIRVEVPE